MTMHAYNPLRLVRRVEQLSTPDWAEQNIYLSPRVPTSEPGQWRRDNVAAICRPGGPLESLDGADVETVVVCKGAQTAMTTTGYVWLAKCQASDPASALIVMNSTQDARDKSGETWKPIWEDSHKLARFLPIDRRKCWTNLYQRINGSGVYWVGANSAGRLASKPIRRLLLDEEDKYPRQFGTAKKKGGTPGGTNPEAGAAQLALQRVKVYRKKGQAKILRISTPTDDQGGIHAAFQNGDKRSLFVKCHACGQEQVMVWQSFRVDMDLAKLDPGAAVAGAHYECQHCKTKWNDEQRWQAIDAGVWRGTCKPRDPRCRSYWFPSWLSKFVTMQYLAAQWIQAQATRSGLQDFINSECGEAFVHYDNIVKDEAFGSLEGAYREGQLWLDCEPYKAANDGADRWVIGGVDVQKNYLVASFRQFAAGGDSGLIWCDTVSDLDALEGLANKFNADFVFMDQRYRKREIQEWCADHPGYVPCEGVKTAARSVFTTSRLDIDEGRRGQGQGREIEVIGHDGDQIKDILATMLDRRDSARRWMIPRGYAGKDKYIKWMTAERCVNGRWVNPGDRPNHGFDAECLCIVGALRLGILRIGMVDKLAKGDA